LRLVVIEPLLVASLTVAVPDRYGGTPVHVVVDIVVISADLIHLGVHPVLKCLHCVTHGIRVLLVSSDLVAALLVTGIADHFLPDPVLPNGRVDALALLVVADLKMGEWMGFFHPPTDLA